MRQSVTMATAKEEEEEEEGVGHSFVWRVSLTCFDGDKGCCRGKQHQSIKILRESGTPEDQVCVHERRFFPSSSSSPSLTHLLLVLTYLPLTTSSCLA